MNRRMILYVLSRILLCEAALMVPSLAVGILYREAAAQAFLPPIALLLLFGLALGIQKPKSTAIYARDGFFIVASAWILLSLVGAIPLWLGGGFASFWDCIFEIVSGFTTTGASVLSAPELLPKCILFWRSFSHWVGGMGVLVFVLAIVPLSDDRSLHLMRAEVPGPVVGKLVPRMRDTAKILYGVYSVMTVILIILLKFGGMSLFDASCYAFGTAGTGGFGTSAAGVGGFNSAYIDIVLGVFMLLFGVNFNLYYFILIKRASEAFQSEELRVYIGVVVLSTALIACNILSYYDTVESAVRHAFFQVSTIITTTGFATADFARWPQFSQTLLVLLMICGACAGSTGGGLKISRCILLLKTCAQEIRRLIHPRAVSLVRLEGKSIDDDTMRGTLAYFSLYMAIVLLTILLLSLNELDFTTNVTATLACFNNIGPGLGQVGPMGNYSMYSPFSKMLLSLNMLLGRLEILPIMVLFSPRAWRRNIN